MYLYAFTRYAGHDRVFIADLDDASEWDLLMMGNEHYLVLGEEVAWKEQISYKLPVVNDKRHIVIPALLSIQSMQLLHRFVNEWYTTYKNSVPLRVHDIGDVVKREESKKSKISKNSKNGENAKVSKIGEVAWQQLIVFPDLRTLEQWNKSPHPSHVVLRGSGTPLKKGGQTIGLSHSFILHGQSTKKQRSEVFRWIKNWTIKTLVCTYSQIFQDWNDLTRIILIDQQKRYYKNQKDPRYYIPSVVEKMGEIYGCNVTKTWWDLLPQ